MPQLATPVPRATHLRSPIGAPMSEHVSWANSRIDRRDCAARFRTLTHCARSMCRSRVVSRPTVGFVTPTFWMAAILAGAAATLAASSPQNGPDVIGELLRDPTVQAARAAIRDLEPQTIDTQATLCEIPAPPFAEGRLLARCSDSFRRRDSPTFVSTTLAMSSRSGAAVRRSRCGGQRASGYCFPRRHGCARQAGRQDTLEGAGISDDCRGLAVLVGVARAINLARVKTAGSLTFVGTVGEEGSRGIFAGSAGCLVAR